MRESGRAVYGKTPQPSWAHSFEIDWGPRLLLARTPFAWSRPLRQSRRKGLTVGTEIYPCYDGVALEIDGDVS
jgi:hypothetical protein